MLTNREINKIMLHFLNKEELTIGELHHCGITDIQIYNACLTEQLLKVRSGINPFTKEGSRVFSYLSGVEACGYLQEKKFPEDIILKPDSNGDNVLFRLEKELDLRHTTETSVLYAKRSYQATVLIGVVTILIGIASIVLTIALYVTGKSLH